MTAAHRLAALPAAQGHDDLPAEAGVERHGRAVMPQVMEVKGATLIVNRDPRGSVVRCRKSTVHRAGASTAPITVAPRAW